MDEWPRQTNRQMDIWAERPSYRVASLRRKRASKHLSMGVFLSWRSTFVNLQFDIFISVSCNLFFVGKSIYSSNKENMVSNFSFWWYHIYYFSLVLHISILSIYAFNVRSLTDHSSFYPFYFVFLVATLFYRRLLSIDC